MIILNIYLTRLDVVLYLRYWIEIDDRFCMVKI
jgi:hypothetical protein